MNLLSVKGLCYKQGKKKLDWCFINIEISIYRNMGIVEVESRMTFNLYVPLLVLIHSFSHEIVR